MARSIFICLACMLVMSCTDTALDRSSQPVDSGGWRYDESLAFQLDIPEAETRYGLYLLIDHRRDIAYQNIYLQIATGHPGDSLKAGIASFQLQGPSGRWLGDCGSQSCSVETVLKAPVQFKKSGPLDIKVYPYTRDSSLQGVERLEFILEPWLE